jgi:Tfp pilus assembly protein PilN
LEINKEQTLLRREKIQQLRSEIQTLKERLTSYRKWRGQRVGLDEMLDGTIEYLNEQVRLITTYPKSALEGVTACTRSYNVAWPT